MTDGDPPVSFIRQFLQFQLPEAYPAPVTSSRVGRDQQPGGLRVGRFPHRIPPTADTLHRKRRGVVVHSHAHPGRVLRQVVDPIRCGPAPFANHKVVNPHSFRIPLRSPLPPAIFEVANQFLLLGVYGNDRLPSLHIPLHLLIEVLELCLTGPGEHPLLSSCDWLADYSPTHATVPPPPDS